MFGFSSRTKLFATALAGGAVAMAYVVTHPPETPGLTHPLGSDGKKWRISSPFGARIDPITGIPAGHSGIDFAVPVGTPVFSPVNGEIYRIDREGVGSYQGNGNAIHMRFDGYKFSFLHLSEVLVGLGPVNQGTMIAKSGNTGRSTGPHLHYQIVSDVTGVPVNPTSVHSPGTFA